MVLICKFWKYVFKLANSVNADSSCYKDNEESAIFADDFRFEEYVKALLNLAVAFLITIVIGKAVFEVSLFYVKNSSAFQAINKTFKWFQGKWNTQQKVK